MHPLFSAQQRSISGNNIGHKKNLKNVHPNIVKSSVHYFMLIHERRLVMSQIYKALPKSKGKVHPRTDNEGSQGSRGIILLFL
jgi:hypothetical protein